MAQFVARIEAVPTGGPYCYSIDKDGVGLKAAVGLATISAALDAVKTDIGNSLAGFTVTRTTLNVTTNEPSP